MAAGANALFSIVGALLSLKREWSGNKKTGVTEEKGERAFAGNKFSPMSNGSLALLLPHSPHPPRSICRGFRVVVDWNEFCRENLMFEESSHHSENTGNTPGTCSCQLYRNTSWFDVKQRERERWVHLNFPAPLTDSALKSEKDGEWSALFLSL